MNTYKVTDQEGLFGLPQETLVRSSDGLVYESVLRGSRWQEMGMASLSRASDITMPATVLWIPGTDDPA